MRQTELHGEDSQRSSTAEVVRRFHEAIDAQDIDAMMALMTDDAVFETTTPPDGQRFEGHDAVRGAFLDFLRSSPNPHFEIEEMIVSGDRAIVRWLYRWTNPDGSEGHVRGVDVIRIRDGRLAESLAYVKG